METPGEELFLVLSDQCNMRCGHCISSSGPESKRFQISKQEIEQIANWVNHRPKIKQIHFSGGEPSLQLDSIRQLQAKVVRPVRYAMTTNGWFGNHPEQVLDKIQIHEVFVSLDRFHAVYGEAETVKMLLQECIRRKISTYLKLTAVAFEDFELAKGVLVEGVKLWINKIIRAGRFAAQQTESVLTTPLDEVLKNSCPSLECRPNGLERIVFHPSKGLTPCCGPLSFDGKKRMDFVFSPVADDYPASNPLRQTLRTASLGELALETGVDVTQYKGGGGSACDLCTDLLEDLSALGLPSRYELAHQKSDPAFFGVQKKLPLSLCASIGRQLELTYFFGGEMKKNNSETQTTAAEFDRVKISENNISDGMDLYEKIYLRKFSDFITQKIKDAMEVKLRAFLLNAPLSYLYYRANVPFGIIAALPDYRHPVLDYSTTHVGFLGYRKDLCTQEVARHLKGDWMQILASQKEHRRISARIQWFNEPSLLFFESLGLNPVLLEVAKSR